MMRFLAVYSTAPFQGDCTISEVYSKFSEKKSKKFFQSRPTLNYRKVSETPVGCTF